MSNDKRNKSNRSEINSKANLLQALKPFCQEVPWMGELIVLINQTHLPENDFEFSGLLRKICYELILEKPDLFTSDHPKTHELKTILYNSLARVKVKRSQELLSKMMQRVANELSLKKKGNNASRM